MLRSKFSCAHRRLHSAVLVDSISISFFSFSSTSTSTAVRYSSSSSSSSSEDMAYYPRPFVPPHRLHAQQQEQLHSVRTRSFYADRAQRSSGRREEPLPKFDPSDETDGTFVQLPANRRQQRRGRIPLPAESASASTVSGVKSRLAETAAGADSDSEIKFIERKERESDFLKRYNDHVDKLWYSSKQHLRDQDKMIANFGSVEGAVRERLEPTRVSLREEIRRRPLDRKVLEEIHREQHGKRVERHLRKGMHFEHWVAQGGNNVPVLDASKKARSLFGFGGEVQQVARARAVPEFPVSSAPEVAFAGKTNSGKSSLVNALLNSFVCRHGALPGTTCTANFYSVAGSRLSIVDLPGYGFYHPTQTTAADADNAVRVMKEYLTNGSGRNIRRVFVCASSTGLNSNDIAYLELLERSRVPFSVISTKTDLVAVKNLAKTIDYTRAQLTQFRECKELMMASSLRLAGINKIQNILADIAKRDTGAGGGQDEDEDDATGGMNFRDIV